MVDGRLPPAVAELAGPEAADEDAVGGELVDPVALGVHDVGEVVARVDRDPAQVAAHHGVSGRGRGGKTVVIECAEDVYGVAINRAMMTIDFAKTEKLRADIRSKRAPLEVTTPNRPGASDWVRNRLRQGDEYLIDPQ